MLNILNPVNPVLIRVANNNQAKTSMAAKNSKGLTIPPCDNEGIVFFKKKSTMSIIAINDIVRIDIAYFAIMNTASPRELFKVKGIVNEYFLGRWLFGDSKFDSFL